MGESKVRIVDPIEVTKVSCLAGGEYIILGDDFMHQWIPLEVGSKVPENAVLAGYDPNFSPLFIVIAQFEGIPVSGYYHPGTKMAHFIFGREQTSTNLKILTIKSKHAWCMYNVYIYIYILYMSAYCVYSIDSKQHNIRWLYFAYITTWTNVANNLNSNPTISLGGGVWRGGVGG